MRQKLFYIGLMTLISLMMTACGTAIQQPSIPTTDITEPASNSTVKTDEPVTVKYSARDVNGISQVELVVNGEPVMVQPVDPPVNIYSAQHIWTPDTIGSYVIELRAFNVDGNVSEAAQIFMTVEQGIVAVTETPTEVPPPTPTATLVVATDTPVPEEEPTATDEPTPTDEPTATDEPDEPTAEDTADGEITEATLVVVSEAVFVRAGPSVDYAKVGKLAQDETAQITGQDKHKAWWQIVYPVNSNQRAWVSNDAQFTVAKQTENVKIVSAPSNDQVAEAEAGATTEAETTDEAKAEVDPVETPIPAPIEGAPIIHSFEANQTALRLNEKLVLKWDLSEANEAYLSFDGVTEGVVSPGEKVLYPQQDTTYTLITRNDVGETTAQVVVTVDTENPLTLLGPPSIYYFSADRFNLDSDDDDENNVVTLRWELANAKEAYLKYDDKEQGVVSPGEKIVVPRHETTYRLEAKNDHGRTKSELIIAFGRSSAPAGSSPPAINSFVADRLEINFGETVILRWDVANAKEAFFGYDGNTEGVPSPGERAVSPSHDTTYILETKNDSGKTISELTIVVK
ncbi:Ig-like domain-containing protein [Anaerolineales bacterium HSG6]|nr:Ig-like domain-containing protein [Anaerolineales bacterium HSG6]